MNNKPTPIPQPKPDFLLGNLKHIDPNELVQSLIRLGNQYEGIIHKNKAVPMHLPTGYPVSLVDLLSNYVELSQPITKKQLLSLADACPCLPEKNALFDLSTADKYPSAVLAKRLSVLDLLERFASCSLSIGAFLAMLPPLKPRQYSISSSPLWNPQKLSLTVAIVESPSWSGQGTFQGVASNYLAYLQPGSKLRINTRPSVTSFHLPPDPETPIIMVCAGTGLAPFRGFIQERALQKEGGQKTGAALLFFGCDHPDVDYLYHEELKQWEAAGVVKVYVAFSEQADNMIKYVQDRLWQERQEVFNLFEQNAKIYVCGDGKHMAPGVRTTFLKMYVSHNNASYTAAEKWISAIEQEGIRYVTDVFI